MSKELIKKYQKKKNINSNFLFDGFDILTLLIKKQNERLIDSIGVKKDLDIEEIEEMKEEFLKVGYYTPMITKNKYEQDSQIYIIKKKLKKYKKYFISN